MRRVQLGGMRVATVEKELGWKVPNLESVFLKANPQVLSVVALRLSIESNW